MHFFNSFPPHLNYTIYLFWIDKRRRFIWKKWWQNWLREYGWILGSTKLRKHLVPAILPILSLPILLKPDNSIQTYRRVLPFWHMKVWTVLVIFRVIGGNHLRVLELGLIILILHQSRFSISMRIELLKIRRHIQLFLLTYISISWFRKSFTVFCNKSPIIWWSEHIKRIELGGSYRLLQPWSLHLNFVFLLDTLLLLHFFFILFL